MLTVWGRRSSFNVQKVMWTIGELGLDGSIAAIRSALAVWRGRWSQSR